MKRTIAFFCLILLILSFTGCDLFNGGGSSITPEPEKEWTIMVWLDGDNDLNAEAIVDFHQMEYGLYLAEQTDSDLTDHINVIVQYDSSPSYTTNDSTAGRYKALPDSSEGDAFDDLTNKIQNLEEPNMGSAEDLGEFIDFCKLYYPAENYGLILWNHGGGVRTFTEDSDDVDSRAICWDDSSDDDALYIGELKDWLDSSHSVDFLGMDACLMGYAEVAYEFRPGTGDFSADFMAASPATEQIDGWEYQMIFNRLCGSGYTEYSGWGGDVCYDVQDLTAEQLATIVVEEYGDAFSDDSWETMTAIDLSEMADVKTAVDAFASAIAGSKATIEGIRGAEGTQTLLAYFDDNGLKDYSTNPNPASTYKDEWYSYPGFDLYELAEQVRDDNSLSPAIHTAADNLMAAVDDAVVLSWAHSGYGTAYGTGIETDRNGLAIFFPDGDATYVNENSYWFYQDWYNGVDINTYENWAVNYYNGGVLSGAYGGLDFLNSDGDGTVESWFELLQNWYNPAGLDSYNPGNLE